jgi:glucose-1-phosphate thymidylyltransferase
MAGLGKRMRPHTLTIPKPLIRIAGKPIVQRLVEEIVKVSDEKVDEIGFIIGDFGKEVETSLLDIATSLGSIGKIFYQLEPLGTAHAINCAAEMLNGHVTVAFADTLFDADFNMDVEKDGIIWVHRVQDPSAFGVVTTDADGIITGFTEKPKEFVSDQAIIGIYYFREGETLRTEIDFLLKNQITTSGEYQLTDALKRLMAKGLRFHAGQVREWLDCGNKDATVYTNQRILELNRGSHLISDTARIHESIIIEPCFIGHEAVIEHSIIGPHASIGRHSKVLNSIIRNSIIQTHSFISSAHIENSMLGNHSTFEGSFLELSMGDFTQISESSND